MSIIVFGNGAREVAIIRSLLREKKCSSVYSYGESSNPDIVKMVSKERVFVNSYKNIDLIKKIILENGIVLALIGPERPLALGLTDKLKDYISVIGPTQQLSKIESSKRWARNFIRGIGLEIYNPDFIYITNNELTDKVDNIKNIKNFIELHKGRVVIKLDGLEGGKGVSVWGRDFRNVEGCLKICNNYIFNRKNFLVEECLEGLEFSSISISDGVSSVGMPPVVDYKPLYDGNTGPNTGSMGAILDKDGLHFLSKSIVDESHEINARVLRELKFLLGESYVGFLYGSYMLTNEGLKIIEFNCRLGDPESVLLLESMETSLYTICEWLVNKNLGVNAEKITYAPHSMLCKYVVPTGYPEQRIKGVEIDLRDLGDEYEILTASVENGREEGVYSTCGSRSLLVLGKTDGDLKELEIYMNAWLSDIKGPVNYRTDLTKLYYELMTLSLTPSGVSLYKDCGVDIDLVSETLSSCVDMIEETHTIEVVKNRGGFGGMFSLNTVFERDLTEPILVTSTDGVGTKTEFVYKYLGAAGFEGLGKDLVNHCINDILVQGAYPLYFVDYFASSRFSPNVFKYFMRGVTEACVEGRCALLGGETAEMPGVYHEGSHDVVGTITGIVDGADTINGLRDIVEGDVVIGIPSNGLHTNGFSLIRKIYDGVQLEDEYVRKLVGFHRSYLNEIMTLREKKFRIHGLCHITGGGLVDNPPRVLPKHLEIEYSPDWEMPEMYRRIQRDADLSELELRRVFNCGVGLMIFVPSYQYEFIYEHIKDAFLLGHVIRRSV